MKFQDNGGRVFLPATKRVPRVGPQPFDVVKNPRSVEEEMHRDYYETISNSTSKQRKQSKNMPYGIDYKRIKILGNLFVVKPGRAVLLLPLV